MSIVIADNARFLEVLRLETGFQGTARKKLCCQWFSRGRAMQCAAMVDAIEGIPRRTHITPYDTKIAELFTSLGTVEFSLDQSNSWSTKTLTVNEFYGTRDTFKRFGAPLSILLKLGTKIS